MNISPETNSALVDTFKCEAEENTKPTTTTTTVCNRLTVYFDADAVKAYTVTPKGRRSLHRAGTVLYYVEAPRKTPTGGRYVARQFTLRTPDGKKWWGTLKKNSSIVRCRPATDNAVPDPIKSRTP